LRRMRILLTSAPFYPDPVKSKLIDISPPLAIYLLASLAELAGHDVQVLDPCLYKDLESEEEFRKAFSGYDALCFSATSSTWPETARTLKRLQLKTDRPFIILGGLHASLFDEYLLRKFPIDFIVRGEGEKTLPALLDALGQGRDPGAVDGISFLQGGEVIRTPERALLSEDELNENSVPRYDLIPPGYYHLLPVETSRGCRYRCVFCSIRNPRTWRGISPQAVAKVLDRAEPYLDSVLERGWHVVDDCFLSRGQDLDALSEALCKSDGAFALNSRVNEFLDPLKLKSYTRLNVLLCEIGVECGYKDGLRRVKKGILLEQVDECARILRERELIDRINFSYIIGLPWERRVEAMDTIKYAFGIAKKYGGGIELGWHVVYPGSEIYFHPEIYGVEMSPEIYDRKAWWRDKKLFYLMRPELSRADVKDILYLLSWYKEIHPSIRTHFWLEEKKEE